MLTSKTVGPIVRGGSDAASHTTEANEVDETKVRILRPTAVGGVHYKAGQMPTIPNRDAAALVDLGKASIVRQKAREEAAATPAPEQSDNNDDNATTDDASGSE